MPAIDPTRPLRVAVAGFGQAGGCHVQAWASMPGATIVGVYSLRPDVEATAIIAMCGGEVPVYSDYRRMLDETGCDFVSICTLHDTHAAEAIAAAERGKHFIVEKPICLTPEDLFAVRPRRRQGRRARLRGLPGVPLRPASGDDRSCRQRLARPRASGGDRILQRHRPLGAPALVGADSETWWFVDVVLRLPSTDADDAGHERRCQAPFWAEKSGAMKSMI